MRSIGKITTVLAVGLLAFAVLVGVRSIPDIRRYLKMRQM